MTTADPEHRVRRFGLPYSLLPRTSIAALVAVTLGACGVEAESAGSVDDGRTDPDVVACEGTADDAHADVEALHHAVVAEVDESLVQFDAMDGLVEVVVEHGALGASRLAELCEEQGGTDRDVVLVQLAFSRDELLAAHDAFDAWSSEEDYAFSSTRPDWSSGTLLVIRHEDDAAPDDPDPTDAPTGDVPVVVEISDQRWEGH